MRPGTVMPRENSIHQGLIVCTKEYGAFVQLGPSEALEALASYGTISPWNCPRQSRGKGDKYKDGFLHIGCLPNPPGVERVEVVPGLQVDQQCRTSRVQQGWTWFMRSPTCDLLGTQKFAGVCGRV